MSDGLHPPALTSPPDCIPLLSTTGRQYISAPREWEFTSA
jgi:hypothetical protein